MKKNILLTRPIEDSLNLETKIKEIGFNVIISPMLVVKKIRAYPIKKTKIDIIFFTSRNGIRNLNSRSFLNTIVLTVGNGTYLEAKSRGYKNIHNADGSSDDLLKLYNKKFEKKNHNILHPTSTEKNKKLEDFFLNKESTYISYPVYKAINKNVFPKKFKNFFSCNNGTIVLFSIKTTETFLNELNKMQLKNKCKDKTLIVLSENIRKKLDKNDFKKVFVLKKPNQENLISLITDL